MNKRAPHRLDNTLVAGIVQLTDGSVGTLVAKQGSTYFFNGHNEDGFFQKMRRVKLAEIAKCADDIRFRAGLVPAHLEWVPASYMSTVRKDWPLLVRQPDGRVWDVRNSVWLEEAAK